MYKYRQNIEDKEYPDIKWFCYGNPETNQLHIWAEYNGNKYQRIVDSPVFFPRMIDRWFGMDISDANKFADISNEIFEQDLRIILEKGRD